MKVLIEVSRQTWGKVKDVATVKDISVSFAVEKLLTEALANSDFFLDNQEVVKN